MTPGSGFDIAVALLFEVAGPTNAMIAVACARCGARALPVWSVQRWSASSSRSRLADRNCQPLCRSPACASARAAGVVCAAAGALVLAAVAEIMENRQFCVELFDGERPQSGWFNRPPAPLSASRQKWTAKRDNTHVVAAERRRFELR